MYSSCLLQSYGILPSAPLDIQVTNIESDFVIIHWATPHTLAETVRSYNIHYHEVHEDEDETPLKSALDVKSPHILSKLLADTKYEVYVQAVNEHGVGEPSQRIVFKTPQLDQEEQLEQVILMHFKVERIENFLL